MKELLRIIKMKKGMYHVYTANFYLILVNEVRGIGIYFDGSTLCKTYRHTDIAKAINYICKKELLFA